MLPGGSHKGICFIKPWRLKFNLFKLFKAHKHTTYDFFTSLQVNFHQIMIFIESASWPILSKSCNVGLSVCLWICLISPIAIFHWGLEEILCHQCLELLYYKYKYTNRNKHHNTLIAASYTPPNFFLESHQKSLSPSIFCYSPNHFCWTPL